MLQTGNGTKEPEDGCDHELEGRGWQEWARAGDGAGWRCPDCTDSAGAVRTRIPIGGRIRAGIKVLTCKAAEVAEAKRLYDEGVAQGRGFDAIERDITAKCEGLSNPLTPKNVPYFTVRGEDFPNPEIARQIMDLYAEDRGDGVRRLYRFPVVFPADENACLPSQGTSG